MFIFENPSNALPEFHFIFKHSILRIGSGHNASHRKSRQTDSLLLPRIAKGDEEAMRKMYRCIWTLVWSIVCRRIDQRTEAEETCQDIFAEI